METLSNQITFAFLIEYSHISQYFPPFGRAWKKANSNNRAICTPKNGNGILFLFVFGLNDLQIVVQLSLFA